MRKIIQKFMKQWPKQTMDVVVALYRENGPESIEFHDQIFTNKDLLMDDEVYDKYKKQLKYKE